MLRKLTIAFAGAAALLLSAQARADVLGVLVGGATAGSSTLQGHATLTGGTGYSAGSGMTFPASGAGYQTSGFGTTSQAAAITANDFVTWGLSYNVAWNLDNFAINYVRNANGPQQMVIQIAINQGITHGAGTVYSATPVFTDTSVSTTAELQLTVDLTAFDNVTSVIFRMVGWNANNTGGTFQFQNTASITSGGSWRLQGTAVPEPAAAGLLGLLALGLLRRRSA